MYFRPVPLVPYRGVTLPGSHRTPEMKRFVDTNHYRITSSGSSGGVTTSKRDGIMGLAAAAGSGGAWAPPAAATGKPVPSHYMYGNLYDMGKLMVPQGHATEEFAAAIVRDFSQGHYGALTENNPGIMRFYLDIDWESEACPTEDEWQALEAAILKAVKRFYPEDAEEGTFDMVVCSAGVRDTVVRTTGRPGYKAGLHVIFMNLYVTTEQALTLSTAIITCAEHSWPEAPGVWRSRIDQAVYGPTRGLRWVWQLKSKPCDVCGDVDAATGKVTPNYARAGSCESCVRGFLADTTASMYAPVYMLNGDTGVRDAITPSCRTRPQQDLMLACSIRYVQMDAVTPGFTVYAGAPAPPVLGKKGGCADVDDALIRAAANKAVVMDPRSPEVRAAQDAIRRIHENYGAITVKALHRAQNGNWYCAYVRGEGDRFCMNKKGKPGTHNNATVKFYFVRAGVQQRCNCRCPTVEGRVMGMCRNFNSQLYPLLAPERAILFEALSVPTRVAGAASLGGGVFAAGAAPAPDDPAAVFDSMHALAGPGAGTMSLAVVAECVKRTASDVQARRLAMGTSASLACISDKERTSRVSDTYDAVRKPLMWKRELMAASKSAAARQVRPRTLPSTDEAGDGASASASAGAGIAPSLSRRDVSVGIVD